MTFFVTTSNQDFSLKEVDCRVCAGKSDSFLRLYGIHGPAETKVHSSIGSSPCAVNVGANRHNDYVSVGRLHRVRGSMWACQQTGGSYWVWKDRSNR